MPESLRTTIVDLLDNVLLNVGCIVVYGSTIEENCLLGAGTKITSLAGIVLHRNTDLGMY